MSACRPAITDWLVLALGDAVGLYTYKELVRLMLETLKTQ